MKNPIKLLLALLAVALVLLPHELRFAQGNPSLPGGEPYYHARMADLIQAKGFGFPAKDDGISDGRTYKFQPYHWLLAGLARLFGLEWAARLLPAALALCSTAIVYLIFAKLVKKGIAKHITLAYILSPPTLTIAMLASPDGLGLTLVLGSILCLLATSSTAKSAGLGLAVLGSLTSPLHAIFAIILIITAAVYTRKRGFFEFAYLTACLFTLALSHSPSALAEVFRAQPLREVFSDFGGLYGASIFSFCMSIVGLGLMWKHKRKNYFLFATAIILIVLSFLFPLQPYANLTFTVLTGLAMIALASRKWTIGFLRNISLLVIFCGLLFSSIAHAKALANQPPSAQLMADLKELSSKLPKGVVLSAAENGFWIEYFGFPVVLDKKVDQLPNAEQRTSDMAALFITNDLETAKILLNAYGIKYIFITPEMTEGLVWAEPGQGLHFLLANNETFKKRFETSVLGVWEVVQ